jgi:hypothetical protein
MLLPGSVRRTVLDRKPNGEPFHLRRQGAFHSACFFFPAVPALPPATRRTTAAKMIPNSKIFCAERGAPNLLEGRQYTE